MKDKILSLFTNPSEMTPEQIEALKERLNAMEGEQSETEQQPDEEL